MITKEQNDALLVVGNSVMQNPSWSDYAWYCFDREKGLRKEAFKHLENFLKTTDKWTLNDKINFLKFILPLFETIPKADYGPFPNPLSKKLVEPTLLKWCDMEKIENLPFRWYGKFYRSEKHLFKALELNPIDDLARQTLIKWWIYDIYYSVHHLPEFYIGNPFEDAKLGEKIMEHIQQLTTSELKEYWKEELEKYFDLVENYIEWKVSKHINFEKWGQANKKRTQLDLAAIYYV